MQSQQIFYVNEREKKHKAGKTSNFCLSETLFEALLSPDKISSNTKTVEEEFQLAKSTKK